MFLPESRNEIQRDFEKFCRFLPGQAQEIRRRLAELDEDTALAMRYLYANMPLSDVGNYPFETWLDFACRGVWLFENSPLVRDLPEELFRGNVLYHRVNEEEIRPCRALFGKEIEPRIRGLNTREAILEINYWCAEKMTYHSTDERTSSAYSCYRKGYGRCGEESVLAVNALRSVGIPARQVYVPRWAHCDDNHAWVEVWCEGEWHYLGACEPEPILDRGWFTGAASRAMMVHSRCFEKRSFGGEAAGTDGMNIMENQLSRYADTTTIRLRAENPDGTPIPGARITAEVLNYAGFYPVAVLETDASGCARLETGLGTLHLTVSCGNSFGERFVDTQREKEARCVPKMAEPEDSWMDFEMAAPKERSFGGCAVTKKQEEENDRRCAEAAERRIKNTESYCPAWKGRFLPGQPRLAAQYLSVLSEKDRSDADPEVLTEHYEESLAYQDDYPRDIFLSCVWNPRVADEVLSKWRRFNLSYFSEEQKEKFRRDPAEIWRWIRKNLISLPQRERRTVYTVPAAALKLGIAQPSSQRVLFTAIARTLGIPARLSPEDGSMEYWREGKFLPVLPKEEKTAQVIFRAESAEKWIYSLNWSFSQLKTEGFYCWKLTDAGWKNGEYRLAVAPGRYRVLTANRLPTGNILASRYDFQIEEGACREIVLRQRKVKLQDMLDRHRIVEHELTDGKGRLYSLAGLTKNGRRILCWLDVGKEPTEHILNEFTELKEAYQNNQKKMAFILRDKAELKDPGLQRCLAALPDVPVYYDSFGRQWEMTARQMYVDPGKLPLLVVADGAAVGIFAAAGYSVGAGELLLRILES